MMSVMPLRYECLLIIRFVSVNTDIERRPLNGRSMAAAAAAGQWFVCLTANTNHLCNCTLIEPKLPAENDRIQSEDFGFSQS